MEPCTRIGSIQDKIDSLHSQLLGLDGSERQVWRPYLADRFRELLELVEE